MLATIWEKKIYIFANLLSYISVINFSKLEWIQVLKLTGQIKLFFIILVYFLRVCYKTIVSFKKLDID